MSNLRNIYFSQFFHRRNPDATIDSICGVCFETIATAVDRAALEMEELTHYCPGARFSKGTVDS